MQRNSSTPYPPPDVHPTPAPPPTEPPSARPDFLVIGLFALRLTKRLIEGLEYYPGRDADIGWLDTFLSAYHHHYALAKISGARQEDYLRLYPEIVSRMKRQPRYPMRFMQIDPARVHHRADQQGYGEMTDAERLELIDFADSAGEWGSIVLLPASEAKRMVALAEERRIADLNQR